MSTEPIFPKFAPARVETEKRADGSMVLRSPMPLGAADRQLGVWLRRWAAARPDATFLAERDPSGAWRRLSYAEALAGANALSQAFLDRGLGPTRPVMILSGNALDHALVALGAMQAGIPIAPVSPAYSLMSQDFAKVKYAFDLTEPGLIYAAAHGPFAGALGTLDLGGVELVLSAPAPAGTRASLLGDLLKTRPTDAVERAFAAVRPDMVAKYLLTSGSTGMPKAVINTHGMLTVSQQMGLQAWPFVAEEEPPVLLDWLPWNHTFGGNHNFGLVLRHGGSLYIDAGRPAPGLIEHTVANLKDIAPSIYLNVPAGYNALLPYLEKDQALRENFFRRLRMVFYAAAALPEDLWRRMEAVAIATTGRKPTFVSSWGSTETAPLATTVHFPIERAGVIGLPVPGVEVKLVPSGAKLEMRVRGPNVTPGYHKRPDLTKAAFDEEGFYRIGDAGKFVDPADPAKGLAFDGRVAEDFKLITGTWVPVGMLRVAALAAASPALQDGVVTGHDRDYVGLLAWPNVAACRQLAEGLPADAPIGAVLSHAKVREHVRRALAAHNAAQGGSSTKILRAMLMAEPPSIDANEITDKGYINQIATLARRKGLVEALYREPPGPEVVVV
jgi:feruloyl-CoA synthase